MCKLESGIKSYANYWLGVEFKQHVLDGPLCFNILFLVKCACRSSQMESKSDHSASETTMIPAGSDNCTSYARRCFGTNAHSQLVK